MSGEALDICMRKITTHLKYQHKDLLKVDGNFTLMDILQSYLACTLCCCETQSWKNYSRMPYSRLLPSWTSLGQLSRSE